MFQVPSQVQNIRTLVDGSLKLDVITQELSGKQKTAIFNLHKKIGWFVFKEKQIKKEDLVDLPDFKPAFKGDRTPSQRERAVMWVYFEKNSGKPEDFDMWYKRIKERVIEGWKQKINDLGV